MIESFLSGINCIIDNKISKPNVIPPAPVSSYITFVDPIVKQICVENWGSDGEITYEQAAAVTSLGTAFCYWGKNAQTLPVTSFNELQYFTGLTSLEPDNEGNGAFSGNTQLTEITLPESLTRIGDDCFDGCTALQSLIIPQSVTSIGIYAFCDCDTITEIVLPEGITELSDGIFEGMDSITSIILPTTLTKIGSNEFDGCLALKSITIPASVTEIGDGILVSCPELTTMTCNAVEPPILGANTFINSPKLMYIHVPNDSVDTYKAATGWSDYADIILEELLPPR